MIEELPQVEIREKVTPLKLSEALRLASITGIKQTKNQYRSRNGSYCALGAIGYICGVPTDQFRDQGYYYLDYLQIRFSISHSVLSKIIRWNDSDSLSFSQIADRLEKEEL